ncbi:MAG: AAA family ATPase, partial [Bacteroidia bacterium]|nr:AAA family ATPase [Bacteroidia bacterium]
LFRGLYIYENWNWEKSFPVIKIDFVGGNYTNTENLNNRLTRLLENLYDYHQVSYTKKLDFPNDFEYLILSIYKKYKEKVVILVDEYDKPILDCITDSKTATNNREILKGFYSVIKASDEYLRFVLLTGVSKFSKTSIFSGLNNLTDITLMSDFANIGGYTQDDLVNYFSEYLLGIDLEE